MAFDSRHGPPIKIIPAFTRHIDADLERIRAALPSSCSARPGDKGVSHTFVRP
jgi:hypothetical protein